MTRYKLTHPEFETKPCGVPGLTFIAALAPFDLRRPDVTDVLVSRPKPWLLIVWEPLQTKAPGPPKASAYCCYLRTVIFYHFPHIVRPWHRVTRGNGRWLIDKPGSFEEWDQVETRLTHDDVVEFERERFEICGGHVEYRQKRWWMVRWARRPSARAASFIERIAAHA